MEQQERIAVRYKTAGWMLEVGETKVRELAKSGDLEVIRVGSDPRVTVRSIKRYAERQLTKAA